MYKFNIAHTIPISILIIIGFACYNLHMYLNGYRLFQSNSADKALLDSFLKQNEEEIKNTLIDGKEVKIKRGTGTFSDIKVEGIVFICKNNKIYIAFGNKEETGNLVVKDMDYYKDVKNDFSEFVESVKKNGFGKILYNDDTAGMYFDDDTTKYRNVPCGSFVDLCVTLQLAS